MKSDNYSEEPTPEVIHAVSLFKAIFMNKEVLASQAGHSPSGFNNKIYEYCPFFLGQEKEAEDIANEICLFWEKLCFESDRSYAKIKVLVKGSVEEQSKMLYDLYSNFLSIVCDVRALQQSKDNKYANFSLENQIFLEYGADIVDKLPNLSFVSNGHVSECLKETQMLLNKYFGEIERIGFLDENVELLLKLIPLLFCQKKCFNEKTMNLELISHLYFEGLDLYDWDRIQSLFYLIKSKGKKEKKKEKTQIITMGECKDFAQKEVLKVFLNLVPSLYDIYVSQAMCYVLLERLRNGESFESVLKNNSVFVNKDQFMRIIAHLLLINFSKNEVTFSILDCNETKKLFDKLQKLQCDEKYKSIDLLEKVLFVTRSDKDKKAFRTQLNEIQGMYPQVILIESFEEKVKQRKGKRKQENKPSLGSLEMENEVCKNELEESVIKGDNNKQHEKEKIVVGDIEQKIEKIEKESNNYENNNYKFEDLEIKEIQPKSLLREISGLDICEALVKAKELFDRHILQKKYPSSVEIMRVENGRINIGIMYEVRGGFFYCEPPKHIAKVGIKYSMVPGYSDLVTEDEKGMFEKRLIEKICDYARCNDLMTDIFRIPEGLNVFLLGVDKMPNVELVKHMLIMHCDPNYLSGVFNESTNGSVIMNLPIFKKKLFGFGYSSKIRKIEETIDRKLMDFTRSYPAGLTNGTEGIGYLKTMATISNIISREVESNFLKNNSLIIGLAYMQFFYKFYVNEKHLYLDYNLYFRFLAFDISRKLSSRCGKITFPDYV